MIVAISGLPAALQVQSNLQQQAQLQHQHQQLQHQQAHLAMMAHHQQGGVAHNPVQMMETASPLSQHASRPTTPGDLVCTTSQSMLPQQQGLPGGQVLFSAGH